MHAETMSCARPRHWECDLIDTSCLTPWEHTLGMQCMLQVSKAQYMLNWIFPIINYLGHGTSIWNSIL